jgi:uncharacterized membrane protein
MDTTPQAVSPHQLAWLRDELPRWQAQGLVTGEHAAAILGQYRAVKRAGLARLMLYLGAAFVGVGLIWLVAANLDQLPPFLRFVVVTALWLGITAVAEVLGSRADHGTRSPVVGAVRGLSALAFGAVVFQAAQSLQVPAYEPALVGFWGLGALVYAYAVRGVAPLLVGLGASLVWFVWHVGENGGSGLGVVLALLVAGAVAAGVAVVHDRFGPDEFAGPWRVVGAALSLAGLFTAAVPNVNADDFAPDQSSLVALGLGVAVASSPPAWRAVTPASSRWSRSPSRSSPACWSCGIRAPIPTAWAWRAGRTPESASRRTSPPPPGSRCSGSEGPATG